MIGRGEGTSYIPNASPWSDARKKELLSIRRPGRRSVPGGKEIAQESFPVIAAHPA